MGLPCAPFEILPMEVLRGNDALEIAIRAWEEHDGRWVPIEAEFADELLDTGDAARTDHGVVVIPRTRRWDQTSMCFCVMKNTSRRWGLPALFRLMTMEQHVAWLEEVFDGRSGVGEA